MVHRMGHAAGAAAAPAHPCCARSKSSHSCAPAATPPRQRTAASSLAPSWDAAVPLGARRAGSDGIDASSQTQSPSSVDTRRRRTGRRRVWSGAIVPTTRRPKPRAEPGQPLPPLPVRPPRDAQTCRRERAEGVGRTARSASAAPSSLRTRARAGADAARQSPAALVALTRPAVTSGTRRARALARNGP